MKKLHKQQGMGLVEVLVALIILALGVLGFSALQLRALSAAQDATEQSVAMSTARDLAERMRVNRTALNEYKVAINDNADVDTCEGVVSKDALSPLPSKISLPVCNATTMAEYDATEVLANAADYGQTVVVADCVGSNLNCIYVAWGETEISETDLDECIDSTTGAYIAGTKCLVMEAYE